MRKPFTKWRVVLWCMALSLFAAGPAAHAQLVTSNDSSCTPRAFNLKAKTGTTPDSVAWYATPFTGGAALSTDTVFNTGVLNSTGIYWAKSLVNGQRRAVVAHVGQPATPASWRTLMSSLVLYYPMDGAHTDLSGTNNTPLPVGTTAPGFAADRFGNANRAGNFVRASNQNVGSTRLVANPQNFSYAIWFRTTSNPGGRIMGFGNSQTGSSGKYDRHLMLGTGGRLYFGVYPGGERIVSNTTALNDGNWHHAAVSFAAGRTVLFVDGMAVDTMVASGGEAYDGYFRVGGERAWGSVGSADFFNGQLDEAMVFNRALTEEEIWQIYNSPMTMVQLLTPQFCGTNGDALLAVIKSNPAIKYQALDLSGNAVGMAMAGNGDTLVLNLGPLAATSQFQLRATDTTLNCSVVFADTFTVAVGPFVAAPVINSIDICNGQTATINSGGTDGNVRWFTSETGGTSFSSAASLTTPALATGDSLVYWVQFVDAGGCASTRTRVRVRANAAASYLKTGVASSNRLVAYVFDNGTARELVSNRGRVETAITYGPDRAGNAGGAINFNGSTSRFIVNNNENNPNNFTVSLWFRTTAKGASLVSHGTGADVSSTAMSRSLYIDTAGHLRFAPHSTNMLSIVTIDTVNDGRWHHVAAQFSSTGGVGSKLWLDGNLVATDPNMTGAFGVNGQWKLGFDRINTLPAGDLDGVFTGSIDDFSIYYRQLTALEIYNLAARPAINLTSGAAVCDATNPIARFRLQSVRSDIEYALRINGMLAPGAPVVSGDSIILSGTVLPGANTVELLAAVPRTGCVITLDTVFTIGVGSTPAITGASNVVCGRPTYTIKPTLPANTTLRWYNAATGGTPVTTADSLVVTFSRQPDTVTRYAAPLTSLGCEGARVAYTVYSYPQPRDLSRGRVTFDGIFVYLPFNGNTNDLSGNNRNGAGANITYATNRTGQPGNAAQFNGTNSVVAAPVGASPSTFTMSIWFRTGTTTGGHLIGFGSAASGNSPNYDRAIYMGNDGRLNFGVYTGNVSSIVSPAAGARYNDNAWHHAVAVVNGNTQRLYIDGVSVANNTFTGAIQAYNAFLRIGHENKAGWPNQPTSAFFNGTLDEAQLYTRALTQAEVTALYQGGTVTQGTRFICGAGASGGFQITNAEANVLYRLRNSGGQVVDSVVSATVANLNLNTGALNATSQFTIAASYSGAEACAVVFDSTYTFELSAAPAVLAASDQTICGTGTLTLTVSGGIDSLIRWYTVPVGGTALAIRNDSLITSVINAGDSLVYYVSSVTPVGCESARLRVAARALPAPGNVAAPASNGLVTFFPFTAGSGLDLSGTTPANNGIKVNTIDTTDRLNVRGNALFITGTGSEMTTARQFTNPQRFTIATWVKTTATGGRFIGFSNSQTGGGGSYDRHFYIATGGRLAFGIYNGSERVIFSNTAINDGQWHHIAGSLGADGLKLYVDGQLEASLSTATAAQNYNGWWHVGNDRNVGWSQVGNGAFRGTLDEVRIYGRALTGPEVVQLGRDGVGISVQNIVTCGAAANPTIRIYRSQTGVTYQLRDGVNNVGSAIAGTGDSIDLSVANVATSTNFNILARNVASGCELQLDTTIRVVISSAPAAPAVNDTIRCGAGTAVMRVSAQPGFTYRWFDAETGGNQVAATPTLTTPSIAVTTANPVDSVIRWVVAINQYGCESARTRVRATAYAAPATPAVTAASTTLCPADSVLLTAPAGFGAYVWRQGTTILPQTTQTIYAKTVGAYSVAVRGAGGCQSAFAPNLAITAGTTPPTPTLAWGTGPGGIVRIVATVTGSTTGITYRWYLDGGLVTGNTGNFVDNPAVGTWTVQAVRAGCASVMSAQFVVTNARPVLASGRAALQVYPNPAHDRVTVEASNLRGNKAVLAVYDVLGKQLNAEELPVNNGELQHQLQLGQYGKGMLFIKLNAEGQESIQRVIVR